MNVVVHPDRLIDEKRDIPIRDIERSAVLTEQHQLFIEKLSVDEVNYAVRAPVRDRTGHVCAFARIQWNTLTIEAHTKAT